MVDVATVSWVDLGALLSDVESERVGVGSEAGVLKESSGDRNNMPVLLSQEQDAIKASDGGGERLLVDAGLEKLVDAGIIWPSSEAPSELSRDLFREDAMPGLTPLEVDVVRLQALAFLDGVLYNSVLLDVDRLRSVEYSCRKEGDGKPDKYEFLWKTLELAQSLDDFRDIGVGK